MAELETINAFDVDRTLYDGPLTIWAVGELAAKGALPVDIRINEIAALNMPGNELNYIRSVNRAYPWIVADVAEQTLLDAAHDLAERITTTRIYREMWPELARAQSEGNLVLISNGPDLFVRALGKRMGAAGVAGRPTEEFTQPGLDKWQRLVQAAAEQGLHLTGKEVNAVLERAYGDAVQDVPLLERARTEAVVVNPTDDTFRQQAIQKGWRIIDCDECQQFGDLTPRIATL